MIAVPFVYFSFLALFLYRKKKVLDIAAFIIGIYAAASFFAIIRELYGIRSLGVETYQITPFASLCYCGLLTFCILPFITYSNSLIHVIKPVKREWALKIYAVLAAVRFLAVIILTKDSFIGVITGDMKVLRDAVLAGMYDGYLVQMPSVFRLIMTPLHYFFGCAWIQLFLAFYCRYIQKLPSKYFLLLVFASISGLWMSVLEVDRSGVAYFILSFIAICIFFFPYMTRPQKRNIIMVAFLVFGAAVVYLTALTLAKFGGASGDDMEEVENGLLDYLGQSYMNFCFFFDTFDNPVKTFNLIFPFTAKLFGEEHVGAVVLQRYIGDKTGFFLGLFYTYIGHIIITAGHLIAILYCCFYNFLSYRIFGKLSQKIVTASTAYTYLLFSTVIFLGVFTHFYAAASVNFSAFVSLLFVIWLGEKEPSCKDVISYKERLS